MKRCAAPLAMFCWLHLTVWCPCALRVPVCLCASCAVCNHRLSLFFSHSLIAPRFFFLCQVSMFSIRMRLNIIYISFVLVYSTSTINLIRFVICTQFVIRVFGLFYNCGLQFTHSHTSCVYSNSPLYFSALNCDKIVLLQCFLLENSYIIDLGQWDYSVVGFSAVCDFNRAFNFFSKPSLDIIKYQTVLHLNDSRLFRCFDSFSIKVIWLIDIEMRDERDWQIKSSNISLFCIIE